jgi:hypothetical protein
MHHPTTDSSHAHEEPEPVEVAQAKKPFVAPKLTYLVPKLTKHGTLTEITSQGGFLGTFSP